MSEEYHLESEWKQKLRRRLLAWFTKHQRSLPWRETRDPYRIWVSEIMLQQTQVETVKSYFQRFLDRFPTPSALAASSEQEVLRLWEGLGYYRRARQMHKAAKVIAEQYGGRFPVETDDVRNLPGVGRYTAGAIMSIAFDRREPILEANTIRLFSRLMAFRESTTSAEAQRILWAFAEEILPRKNVGQFNQATMELGSLVCSPKSPKCLECPLKGICPTFAAGLQAEIPLSQKKMKYEDVNEVAVVVYRNRQVLLRRCGVGERWAGMWDFPRFRAEPQNHDELQISKHVKRLTGIDVLVENKLTSMKHGVTRFRITLDCYEAQYESGRTKRESDCKWVEIKSLNELPLSVTGRKITKLVESRK